MTWPTEPPGMPEPGWYADPEQQWTWRWWDGAHWADLRAPMHWAPAPRDPHSFSAWFEQSTAAVKHVVVRVGLFVVAAHALCFAFAGLVVSGALRSDEGEEIRTLLDVDESFESDGTTLDLTDAEWDRVRDLLGDLARDWLPWMVPVVVAFILVGVWSVAVAARAADGHRRTTPAADVQSVGVGSGKTDVQSFGVGSGKTDESRGAAVVAAIRRTPAVGVSYFAVVAVLIVAVWVPLVPMIVAIAADGGGGAIASTAVFGGAAALVLAVWIGGRLSLATALAALGGHGLGLRRSWNLTRGHFWGVVGRLLVAGMIAGVVTAPLSFVNSFGVGLGLTVFVTILLIVQAVSSAASVLVTVPSQVVLVDHLTEQAGPDERPGPAPFTPLVTRA